MPDGGFPFSGGLIFASGSSPTTSLGTTVTSSASAHTKGSWTAVGTTDWSRPLAGFWVSWKPGSNSRSYLMDLGYSLDAGSTWVTVLADLVVAGQAHGFTAQYMPIRIPKNARLGARVQATTGPSSVAVVMQPVAMAPGHPNGMIDARTWGQDLTDTGGVQIDPGGTVNTKGSYVTFAGFSVVNRVHAIAIGIGTQNNAAPTAATWLIDIAFDTGSKSIVVNNFPFANNGTQNQQGPPFAGWFPCNIPRGATLAVRAQCSINDATDRLIDATLYTLA